MNEQDIQDILMQVLEQFGEDPDAISLDGPDAEALRDASTRSFAAGMVLTNNAGLTLTLADGSEYQITIVQSCNAR